MRRLLSVSLFPIVLISMPSALFSMFPATAADGEAPDTVSATADGEAAPETAPAPADASTRVKALYLTGWTVGDKNNVRHYIDLAKATEINAYVVDIKDDDGYVGYASQVPLVCEIKASMHKYKVAPVIEAFHENNIRVIGRIACFKDPILAASKPELAIKDSAGNLWLDDKKKPWLDPYNTTSWTYIIDIAKEGVRNGFDEIQFDYVRFANEGQSDKMAFNTQGKARHEIINEFLAYARKEMPDTILSADVFGIICESPEDREQIGQYLESVGRDIDYISPMVYPSHYAFGQKINGTPYPKPDLDPYGVVHDTLLRARKRIGAVPEYRAGVRPYLQDFTASWLGNGHYQAYGAEQVRQQMKAVYEAGYDEWILWNASNRYSEDALLPEGAEQPIPQVIEANESEADKNTEAMSAEKAR